jgi:CubicO group peptidase (beta-lactamase class C family)
MTTLTSRLEETIRENMERSRVAGLAIALVKNGELVAAEGYGVANVETGEKIARDTRFSIMSVTKTIVSTAVMKLRDLGLLPLDDPVNHFLAPSHITNEFEAESPVTMRQLLTHTGGLPVGMLPTTGKMPLAQFVTTVAKTTYRPGTDMIYANWGFDAAGVVIENLSGEAFGDYLRDAIFKPLGMTASALGNPADGDPRAYGHYRSAIDEVLRTLPLPDWPTIPESPAGGVWSNVIDLSKFLIAHLTGGGGILDGKSVAEMHRLHARQGSSESGQGIGFRVTRVNGRHAILHGGDGSGFTAFIAAHPDEGVGVAILMNTGGMQAARSIIGTTALASLVAPERRTFAGSASIPPGVYPSNFWEIEMESRPPELIPTIGLVMSENPTPSTLRPTGAATFDAEGGMFHGFELTVEGEHIYGGLYPFTFTRSGDLPGPPPPIEENAELIDTWSGHVTTPMGPIPLTLHITSDSALTADTPFAQNVAASNVRAKSGRVEGEFTVLAPIVGEMQLFLRLEARDGKLTGTTYGRSNFGETPFATELKRAD